METTSRRFDSLTRDALGNPTLRNALSGVEQMMPDVRAAAIDELGEFAALRERAAAIRDRALTSLDTQLAAFEARVRASGGEVHHAASAAEACRIVTTLCDAAPGDPTNRTVIKSKSMVTEEIELNTALEAAGHDVVETDLGEYIIQLRQEKPSHILAPALHVTLGEVADAFRAAHPLAPDRDLSGPAPLLAEARATLRDRFLSARAGITGANFLVAETGAAVIVTNEGNADLTATLPDTHIVVTGIEKVVPTLDDVSVLLRLLARSAIGERLSNYTTFIHGPRAAGETSGPRNYHVVLVDNGRRDLLGTEFQEILRCIRCSACINHCPVYTTIGGHAYGSVYSGPMGAVLTPAFASLAEARDLPNASTFCGRCEAVCPVAIPLPKLLRHWREREFSERHGAPGQRIGLGLWRRLNRYPAVYRAALGLAATALRSLSVPGRGGVRWIRRLPGPAGAWTRYRDLRAPEGHTFQALWSARRGGTGE